MYTKCLDRMTTRLHGIYILLDIMLIAAVTFSQRSGHGGIFLESGEVPYLLFANISEFVDLEFHKDLGKIRNDYSSTHENDL